jgi:UDP-N-acetylmuramoylalanine--D-glutamate ligase
MALCRAIGIEDATILETLRRFKGLAHRVEYVESINGVAYYDDSKGTNVGATVAALNGMLKPVVLIAGGDGKGQDFAPLLPAVERICRAAMARACVTRWPLARCHCWMRRPCRLPLNWLRRKRNRAMWC